MYSYVSILIVVIGWNGIVTSLIMPSSNTTTKAPEVTTCLKPHPINGDIRYLFHSVLKIGESITVECNDQYAMKVNGKLVRELLLICGQDGNWITQDGLRVDLECTVSLCDSPPDVPHSHIGFSMTNIGFDSSVSSIDRLVEGQRVHYQCEPGYTLVDSQASHLVCSHGEWLGSPPSCVSIGTCSDPKDVNNARYYTLDALSTTLDTYKLGTRISYICDAGFKPLGPSTLVCLDGGEWSHHPPQCIPDQESSKYCPSVSTMLNGHCFCESKSDLQYCEPFYMGLHVECVCNEGYKLVGQSIVTCGRDGQWDFMMPSCVQEVEINGNKEDTSSSSQAHMSTLAIVVATACSVLGVLLLVMVIMVFRRRKPHPPRLCRTSAVPPPYSRVHSNSLDEQDRMLLIGYDNSHITLPSYDEATRGPGQHSSHFPHHHRPSGQSQVGEYRQLPSLPGNFRGGQLQNGETTSRHSIITTSTMNRDGISEVFGSIDTVNVSMSDASTAVTVETFDSASSHHSNMSRRATAGSINSSNGSLVTEDVPLLESTQRDEEIESVSNQGDVQDKHDN